MKENYDSPYMTSQGSVDSSAQVNSKGEAASERIAWIDIARGIGILLVVQGHLETGFSTRIIYAFHMPLFFFLSGYVHKPRYGYASFLRKGVIHLLVPYVSFLALFAPLWLHRVLRHEGIEAFKQAAIDMIWGGDRLHGDYGVFWFITCLFATQQIANWLFVKCKPSHLFILGVISICLAYVNSVLFPRFTLPLDLNVVLGALPFYIAGYGLKRGELDRWWITMIAMLGVVATAWLAYVNVPISYDMRSAIYGVPFLSLLLAGCCILALIRLSKLILLAPPITKLLEKTGAASMGIMFIHKPLPDMPGFRWLSLFHPALGFVVISFVAYLCTVILSRFRLGRALFLGSQKDFLALRHHISKTTPTEADRVQS